MKSVEQMINERAYAIYEERTLKGLPGNSDSDYYQAAKEVTALVEKKNAAKIKPAAAAAKKAVAPAPKAQVKKSAPAPVAAKPAVKAVPKAAAPAKKKAAKKK
ncbi:MAG: hypothetical protein FWE57_11030 [Chitinispirillia bacterium]|nr:hypothetical protein [Chitinispirillia bacterium]